MNAPTTRRTAMRRTMIGLTAVAALAIPATALADAPSGDPTASQTCKTLRTQMGTSAFEATYGSNKNKSNAFGKCVSAQATEADQARTKTIVNASKTCKAERKADPAAFKVKY